MPETLFQTWRATVRRDPNAFAVATSGDGMSWTRSALATVAAGWAASVPDGGAFFRRRVALAEPNGIGWWKVFLGLIELGAVPVLIDASEPPARQAEIAEAARSAWLWTDGRWVRCERRRTLAAPDECLFKVTSGSTGVPKVWRFTHRQMLADGRQVSDSMGIRGDDVNLGAIPLGHSYGLGNIVVPLLERGTGVVMVDSPFPNVLAAAAAKWRPTVFPAVPPVLKALVGGVVDPVLLASLRLVISAGAAMSSDLATAFFERFHLRVHNFYGSSETGGICYDRSGQASLTGRSVGSPLLGVKLRWRRGSRFWVESEAVVGSGSFSPLDLGRLSDEGELVLIGRAGRLVKLGARRVDLGEIEAALRAIPGVRDASATITTHGRQTLAALVATNLAKPDIRVGLAAKLSAWKQPQRLVIVPSLPYTARGKLDQVAVERLLAGSAPPSGDLRPA